MQPYATDNVSLGSAEEPYDSDMTHSYRLTEGRLIRYPMSRIRIRGVSKGGGSGGSVKNDSFLFLWARLSKIVQDCTRELEVVVDEPGDLRVETSSGRPFVSVRIQRNHVGIYLLPLYYHPAVLPQSLSEKKSGKGTLRFRDERDVSIDDLPNLIENCLALIDHY